MVHQQPGTADKRKGGDFKNAEAPPRRVDTHFSNTPL